MTIDDSSERSHDELDNSFRDHLVAVGKAAVSSVPGLDGVGGLIGEVVTSFIPNQRTDRIVKYLRDLSSKVESLDEELQAQIAKDAEKIDLIEEGGYQAARATSSERIDQIVTAVTNGLSADRSSIIRRKRLLRTFGELDEDEVALLYAYGKAYGRGMGDEDPFESIDQPRQPHLNSSGSEITRYNLFTNGKEHLKQLNLLRKNYGNTKKGELPEFDSRAGDFKHSLEISILGRLILTEIGMPTPFDEERNELQL